MSAPVYCDLTGEEEQDSNIHDYGSNTSTQQDAAAPVPTSPHTSIHTQLVSPRRLRRLSTPPPAATTEEQIEKEQHRLEKEQAQRFTTTTN